DSPDRSPEAPGVTEYREGQSAGGGGMPRELARETVVAGLSVDHRADTRRALAVQVADDRDLRILRHAIEGGEEPKTIAHDAAAHRRAEVVLRGRVVDGGDVGGAEAGRAVLALKAAPREEAERGTVEFIAPGSGEDVEDAAGRPSVFGGESSGLHFDLLDEVEVQLL